MRMANRYRFMLTLPWSQSKCLLLGMLLAWRNYRCMVLFVVVSPWLVLLENRVNTAGGLRTAVIPHCVTSVLSALQRASPSKLHFKFPSCAVAPDSLWLSPCSAGWSAGPPVLHVRALQRATVEDCRVIACWYFSTREKWAWTKNICRLLAATSRWEGWAKAGRQYTKLEGSL